MASQREHFIRCFAWIASAHAVCAFIVIAVNLKVGSDVLILIFVPGFKLAHLVSGGAETLKLGLLGLGFVLSSAMYGWVIAWPVARFMRHMTAT